MLKNILLGGSSNIENNKASDTVSKSPQQLQRDHDIARASFFQPDRHISFKWLATATTWVTNSDHMISNNNNMQSYIIRREERFALKDRSWTADKERSWFEPTIRRYEHIMVGLQG